MKYLDAFREPRRARALADAVHRRVTRPWTLMEVCGGQTHALARFGLEDLLPPSLALLHGPGCPVCVTAVARVDQAQALAARPEVVLCTFGDMVRVPGSAGDLAQVRSRGGAVQVVASPLDALALARRRPDREVVFFAVGFETTAPASALAVLQARAEGLANFSLLVAHVRVPPALAALVADPRCRVEGFLAAGHVCAVMGTAEYRPLAARGLPVVVTGFEPLDLLQGILMAVTQLEEGRAEVEVQYARLVRPEGNPRAQALLDRVFQVVDRPWRGLGLIPAGGFALRPEFQDLDAARRFGVGTLGGEDAAGCPSGLVLQGLLAPEACPAFGTTCTPDHPRGAPMVSAEGACAARRRHARFPAEVP